MTKSELIKRFSKYGPQRGQDAEVVVQTILKVIAESLTRGQRIEIRGFGVFSLNYHPPRAGRNPKSGEKFKVAAKYVPHFKAGKELRDRIKDNKLRSRARVF